MGFGVSQALGSRDVEPCVNSWRKNENGNATETRLIAVMVREGTFTKNRALMQVVSELHMDCGAKELFRLPQYRLLLKSRSPSCGFPRSDCRFALQV